MTLKQIEAFYLAATLGSFVLAAQRAHVTQSSLSKRIAELEIWLKEALFDRSGNRAILTEAGNRLLPVAARMLALKDDARNAASKEPVLAGTCRFGISELGALTWLPRFVANVRLEHPALVLQPHVDLGRRLERQVVRGELDFAVIPGPPESPHIRSIKVDDVPFAWIASPRRFGAGILLKPKTLAKHPVITQTEGSGSTQAFDAWALAQGLRMERIVASNSLMAIIGLTIADIGLSFMPRAFLRPWIEQGALVALDSSPRLPVLPYCFMHREDDRRIMVSEIYEAVQQVIRYDIAAGDIPKTT